MTPFHNQLIPDSLHYVHDVKPPHKAHIVKLRLPGTPPVEP